VVSEGAGTSRTQSAFYVLNGKNLTVTEFGIHTKKRGRSSLA